MTKKNWRGRREKNKNARLFLTLTRYLMFLKAKRKTNIEFILQLKNLIQLKSLKLQIKPKIKHKSPNQLIFTNSNLTSTCTWILIRHQCLLHHLDTIPIILTSRHLFIIIWCSSIRNSLNSLATKVKRIRKEKLRHQTKTPIKEHRLVNTGRHSILDITHLLLVTQFLLTNSNPLLYPLIIHISIT